VKLLADSSIWIDHIRQPNELLAGALRARAILLHPLVIGEIAMSSIASRSAVLASLTAPPTAVRADDFEVLDFVGRHRLFGTGLGLIDAHLLASALLTPGAGLWTRDRRLREAAERLGIAGEPAR
jgi:predicted nucleic acid-binding protein